MNEPAVKPPDKEALQNLASYPKRCTTSKMKSRISTSNPVIFYEGTGVKVVDSPLILKKK